MKCPFCKNNESKVTDSRNSNDYKSIRRRRECLNCLNRFTTFETIDLIIQIRKKDGKFKEFDVLKLIKGINAAAYRTSISREKVKEIAYQITEELIQNHTKEITTSKLGEIVMRKLYELDKIAYIRFACVYKRFKDIDELKHAIHTA